MFFLLILITVAGVVCRPGSATLTNSAVGLVDEQQCGATQRYIILGRSVLHKTKQKQSKLGKKTTATGQEADCSWTRSLLTLATVIVAMPEEPAPAPAMKA